MALDSYTGLQDAILLWIARPGDPLVAPSVPDMITLFEAEARRRLRVIGAEKREYLYAAGSQLGLPGDFQELRHAALTDGTPLEFAPPGQQSRPLTTPGGNPRWFWIRGDTDGSCGDVGGAVMELMPPPSGSCEIVITYQSGLPPLSDDRPTNWLLKAYPDLYLFGSLVEAEQFIGHDERALAWGQRRQMTFDAIEAADRKARWSGAPLVMQTGIGSP